MFNRTLGYLTSFGMGKEAPVVWVVGLCQFGSTWTGRGLDTAVHERQGCCDFAPHGFLELHLRVPDFTGMQRGYKTLQYTYEILQDGRSFSYKLQIMGIIFATDMKSCKPEDLPVLTNHGKWVHAMLDYEHHVEYIFSIRNWIWQGYHWLYLYLFGTVVAGHVWLRSPVHIFSLQDLLLVKRAPAILSHPVAVACCRGLIDLVRIWVLYGLPTSTVPTVSPISLWASQTRAPIYYIVLLYVHFGMFMRGTGLWPSHPCLRDAHHARGCVATPISVPRPNVCCRGLSSMTLYHQDFASQSICYIRIIVNAHIDSPALSQYFPADRTVTRICQNQVGIFLCLMVGLGIEHYERCLITIDIL